MNYVATTATRKVAALTKRIRVIQGGTSASKTVSNVLYLIHRAQADTSPTITSIVSESFPHIRRGVLRDFQAIMQSQNYWDEKRWNSTEFTYQFETGSIIEFFSADQPGKVRGPRRDRLFINEANNIPFETFDQLEVRTKEFVIIDYNPAARFWVFDHYITETADGDIAPLKEDVQTLRLTYKDNEALDQQIVSSIESRMNRPGWWRVYGEGKLGEVEGRIFTGWQTIDEVPPEARLERYGLDFGYTNDPSVIVAIYYWNGAYVVDEITYQKGLSNKQLADILINQPRKALIIADSAEPKSIDELKLHGLSVLPATKGPGSVLQGIQAVQDQRIFLTKRSVNVRRDYDNYLWAVDPKTGIYINEPEHQFSHGPDAIRYPMSTLASIIQRNELINSLPRFEERDRHNPAR